MNVIPEGSAGVVGGICAVALTHVDHAETKGPCVFLFCTRTSTKSPGTAVIFVLYAGVARSLAAVAVPDAMRYSTL